MTKDIMLRISGVQFPDGEENSEEMEVITSGSYFEKDGRHYIKYDEVQEDSNEVIRNLLKIENGSLELTRRGMTNVHMVFEKTKKANLITTPHLEDSWSGSPQHIWMSAKKKTALMCR